MFESPFRAFFLGFFLALAQTFHINSLQHWLHNGREIQTLHGRISGKGEENSRGYFTIFFPRSAAPKITTGFDHEKLHSPIVSICQKQRATSCFSFSLFIIHKKRHFGSTIRLDSTAGNNHTHQISRTKFFTLKTLFFQRELFVGKFLKFSEKARK